MFIWTDLMLMHEHKEIRGRNSFFSYLYTSLAEEENEGFGEDGTASITVKRMRKIW